VLFLRLLPVLVFSNQALFHSTTFFKRLLALKGLLRAADMRSPGYAWDRYSLRVADEVLDYYCTVEASLVS
jgi:hypothetical protein